jgi:thioredoxin reductase
MERRTSWKGKKNEIHGVVIAFGAVRKPPVSAAYAATRKSAYCSDMRGAAEKKQRTVAISGR